MAITLDRSVRSINEDSMNLKLLWSAGKAIEVNGEPDQLIRAYEHASDHSFEQRETQ